MPRRTKVDSAEVAALLKELKEQKPAIDPEKNIKEKTAATNIKKESKNNNLNAKHVAKPEPKKEIDSTNEIKTESAPQKELKKSSKKKAATTETVTQQKPQTKKRKRRPQYLWYVYWNHDSRKCIVEGYDEEEAKENAKRFAGKVPKYSKIENLNIIVD